MKKLYSWASLLALCLFSSFAPYSACEYASSNLGFAKAQTEKAIAENNLNKVRFFTYKALNAIEKTKNDLDKCGCVDADTLISYGKEDLKKAVRTSSLSKAKEHLQIALKNTFGSIEALENHGLHKNKYPDNVLAMNTADSPNLAVPSKISEEELLHHKIDVSLMYYEISLNEIVTTVNCEDARAYATRVIGICETELLKPNLSDGKKYYNLRTKEITVAALQKLKRCN
ncbi:hypothetical protein ACEZ3G_00940 [Maribacter algicola]|uniref:Uncharacterized protein n=1 Tax=Meishania litoralis TaxID=3434685 RepID=A0ACC7LF71_9FLAO